MKIILSRKGFDSKYGGIASPIFEDGTMVSFPIPSDCDKDCYSDFAYDGMSFEEMLNDLGYKQDTWNCHVDPDLDQSRRKEKVDDWVAAFGQINQAASVLKNCGVKEGDLFLFFGTFHFVNRYNNAVGYMKRANDFYKCNDLHVIWGYLEVGEVLDSPSKQRNLWWHPHSDEERVTHDTNVIFKAADTLSFDSSKPGAGLLTFDKKRVLTQYGCSKATWKMNEVYDPKHIYDNRKNSAKVPDSSIYYAGVWQELVLKESDACTEWAKGIVL